MFKHIFNPIVFPLFILVAIAATVVFYVIPSITVYNEKEKIKFEGTQIVQNIQIFRNYYNDIILPKVRANSNIKINFDHIASNTTIPLPATTVHDLGFVLSEHKEAFDIKIDFFSKYPFPNREIRELNQKQKEAIEYLEKNPNGVFVAEDVINGKRVYRVAVADIMNSQNCVNCHNSREDSPRKNWKLGEARGVIEVTKPILNEFILTKFQINMIVTIMFAIIAFFVIYYMVIAIKVDRKKRYYKALLQEQKNEVKCEKHIIELVGDRT